MTLDDRVKRLLPGARITEKTPTTVKAIRGAIVVIMWTDSVRENSVVRTTIFTSGLADDKLAAGLRVMEGGQA